MRARTAPLLAVCAALAAVLPPAPVIAAGTGEFCGPGWQRITTPQVQKVTRFQDVAGVHDDLWAVGYHLRGPKANTSFTMAAHWDGSTWAEVPTPNPGMANRLSAVTVLGPGNAWAVGATDGRVLVEHWNGAVWSVVPTPDLPSDTEELLAIESASATDIWAVGRRTTATTPSSLTMHWNGVAWSVVASPDPDAHGTYLFGVDAVSATDAWAFGATGSGGALNHAPLLMHWNGAGWSTSTVAGGVTDGTFLRTGMEMPGGDLWTVGGSWSLSPTTGVVERRHGTAWTTWSNPATRWEDLDAMSENDLWVAGEGQRASLTSHWDGTGWTSIGVPAHLGAAGAVASLGGTITIAPDEVWVVGGAETSDSSSTTSLALRVCPLEVTGAGIAKPSSRVGQGAGTLWRFPATNGGAHDVTDALGLGTGGTPLFATGSRPPGSTGTFVLDHAGTFPVVDTATGHTAELTVPTEALPKKAALGTVFTIYTSALGSLPSYLGTDIRYRKPGSEFWYRLVSGTKNGATPFSPDQTGVFTIQARLRNKVTGTFSGWSPFATINVTAP